MRKAKQKKDYLRLRIFVVLGFFILFFSVILFRAFDLHVMDGARLKKMATRQHSKTVNIQSKRGDIYDRNLKELAISVEVDSVFAQPGKIEDARAAARKIAPILALPWMSVEKKLKDQAGFVWLKRQVDLDDAQRKELGSVEGIGIVKESKRYYPNRHLASNLVGFTGLDASGLEGVELYYDSILRGSSRKFVGDRDAMGRLLLFEDPDKTIPVSGMEVELTIDKTIQYITEKSLKKAVDETGALGGSVIVMDPATGEILAMASLPTYDPNELNRSGVGHRKNKVIADTFEPGSIFKLFLIASAMEENLIKTSDSIFCENGVYRVADRTFHDTKSHGWLTIPQIIKLSSNIGSAKIGERLGKSQMYRYLKAFGFGAKSGIDLPGEAAGSFRHYSTWSKVTLHTVSFGQGISATSVQLVSALSALANGGFLMKPYVVRSVKDSSGKVISETGPVIIRKVVSEETARKMSEMMIGVTELGGTGTRAALADFEVAGKTGTAQKPDFKHGGYERGAFMASFFGFVPARDPRLAILVVVDTPRGDYHGGTVSAPVFKEIAEESLAYLGVFQEKGGSSVATRPGVAQAKAKAKAPAVALDDEGKTVLSDEAGETAAILPEIGPMSVPDFVGKSVRTVMKTSKERAFDVEVIGSGRAVLQKPAPGDSIPAKGPVVVWFK